ncbi:MAG: ABC transporter permease [Vicinamibacterales bacterium]
MTGDDEVVAWNMDAGQRWCRADARIPAVLAWRNATRHRSRFVMTVAGVAAAVFLMIFQGSLLIGFIHASGRVIDAAGGDLWIVARGVPCFDFPAPLPRRYLDLARQVDDVIETRPMVAGLSSFVTARGDHRGVVMIGAARDFAGVLPLPVRHETQAIDRDGVVVDRSNRMLLDVGMLPVPVEIAGHRAAVVRTVEGFGSFLGSPYVFGDLPHVRDILGLDADEVSYGIVFVRHPPATDRHIAALQRRLPNADVLTADQFAARSAWFWLIQTGAGGAIVVAALLGLIVGLVIVLQTLYASTIESLTEFATLKALGASARSIRRFVALQALTIGSLGSAVGLTILEPLASLARTWLVSWVETPFWLRVAGALAGIVISVVAALSAARTAATVDPMRVLRS